MMERDYKYQCPECHVKFFDVSYLNVHDCETIMDLVRFPIDTKYQKFRKFIKGMFI